MITLVSLERKTKSCSKRTADHLISGGNGSLIDDSVGADDQEAIFTNGGGGVGVAGFNIGFSIAQWPINLNDFGVTWGFGKRKENRLNENEIFKICCRKNSINWQKVDKLIETWGSAVETLVMWRWLKVSYFNLQRKTVRTVKDVRSSWFRFILWWGLPKKEKRLTTAHCEWFPLSQATSVQFGSSSTRNTPRSGQFRLWVNS